MALPAWGGTKDFLNALNCYKIDLLASVRCDKLALILGRCSLPRHIDDYHTLGQA
jgi:hypothetical protein